MSIALPKAAFFDWDGTLADSFACIESAHDHALGQLGQGARAKGWFRSYFGKPRDYIYSDIYGEERIKAQAVFEAYLQQNHTRLVQPLAGVQAMLEAFQQAGVLMGVVTNKRADFVAAEIKAFGWEHFFETVVGAGEALEDKPSAQPLYLALERCGFDGELDDVWFFGDTQADLDCAQGAGVKVVYYGAARDESHILHCVDDYGAFLSFLQQKG